MNDELTPERLSALAEEFPEWCMFDLWKVLHIRKGIRRHGMGIKPLTDWSWCTDTFNGLCHEIAASIGVKLTLDYYAPDWCWVPRDIATGFHILEGVYHIRKLEIQDALIAANKANTK